MEKALDILNWAKTPGACLVFEKQDIIENLLQPLYEDSNLKLPSFKDVSKIYTNIERRDDNNYLIGICALKKDMNFELLCSFGVTEEGDTLIHLGSKPPFNEFQLNMILQYLREILLVDSIRNCNQ